ncbi:uncharacterized protein EDB91DRAFT_617017 [Suillus paluster]|uniref:uncharacterized protein n=1 Tax=Suillus paluster TaxID=48578 RepID=UPI001B863CA6|nr:uncharacterized protein EDB91DRAFT_617017 [Suillus paluster]KAG1751635.1 hypothetical protein EDB91DRAFT_617017 [Suillus paluster]
MRVIIEQQETSSSRSGVSYTCRFCRAENHLSLGSVMHSLARQAGCSIDCRVCKRRFYISRVSRRAKRNTRSFNIDSDHTTEAEMHLIRNFHVQQTSMSSASTSTSNSSVRSVSTTATGGSRRAGGQVSQMPKNVKIMSGVPWELDELPRQRHPNAVGDIFGSPPQRKPRTRKSKLDTIGKTPEKVQMGQSNALAKMLSALRR